MGDDILKALFHAFVGDGQINHPAPVDVLHQQASEAIARLNLSFSLFSIGIA
ncbi:MAG: hypothetical protein ACJAXX_000192 [Roseivirga sp.]